MGACQSARPHFLHIDTLNPIISLINQRKQYIFTTFRLFIHEMVVILNHPQGLTYLTQISV